MPRTSLSRKIKVWYRFVRRRTRGLGRFCINFLSVLLIASRVVELLTSKPDC